MCGQATTQQLCEVKGHTFPGSDDQGVGDEQTLGWTDWTGLCDWLKVGLTTKDTAVPCHLAIAVSVRGRRRGGWWE